MNQPVTVLRGICPYCKGLQHRSPTEVFQKYYTYDSDSMIKCFFCKQNILISKFTPIYDPPDVYPGITNEKIVVRGDDLEELESFAKMIARKRPKAMFDAVQCVEDWARSYTSSAGVYDDILFKQNGKHTLEIKY